MSDCAAPAGSKPETRRVPVIHTTPQILAKMTGRVWVPEYPFAAISVGQGPGIKQRLKQAGLANWRFDFACPGLMVALEIEGGGWVNGGHNRGKGFAKDLEKYDRAWRLGWWVYRCSPKMIKTGWAYESLRIMCDARYDG